MPLELLEALLKAPACHQRPGHLRRSPARESSPCAAAHTVAPEALRVLPAPRALAQAVPPSLAELLPLLPLAPQALHSARRLAARPESCRSPARSSQRRPRALRATWQSVTWAQSPRHLAWSNCAASTAPSAGAAATAPAAAACDLQLKPNRPVAVFQTFFVWMYIICLSIYLL